MGLLAFFFPLLSRCDSQTPLLGRLLCACCCVACQIDVQRHRLPSIPPARTLVPLHSSPLLLLSLIPSPLLPTASNKQQKAALPQRSATSSGYSLSGISSAAFFHSSFAALVPSALASDVHRLYPQSCFDSGFRDRYHSAERFTDTQLHLTIVTLANGGRLASLHPVPHLQPTRVQEAPHLRCFSVQAQLRHSTNKISARLDISFSSPCPLLQVCRPMVPTRLSTTI